jgi:acyl-CoA synthetase (AMP-forming)/AMP-acid ligase II/pyrroloquinoline quinone (PQQ) biosynthesis protein C
MNRAAFFARLAAYPGAAPAVIGARDTLDYAALRGAVDALAAHLREREVRVLATRLDNGPAWIVADLAALAAGIVHVPLPIFFTPAQTAHALQAAGVDALLVDADAADALPTAARPVPLAVAGTMLQFVRLTSPPVPLPAGCAKVTFTSGTTGQPKGVCLAADAMLAVADGLAQALAPLAIARHLNALPLAVLLENLAGVYAPLAAGAACVALPTAAVGLTGSSRFDPARLQAAVDAHAAHSVIVLPQMLRIWTGWRLHRGAGASPLTLVAVGGATVGAAVIQQARASGLPAYEGYGLSEGASVQTLNLPGADRPGSAGRPLPHARLRVAADGELLIGGPLMQGYVGQPARHAGSDDGWWPTGDLGTIDADGFVHLHGRKKNVLITGYGRNVSPEWVEAALQSQPAIAHAVVLGDGEAALWAVLWPSAAGVTQPALDAAVQAANATLPDYARIADWVCAREPFDVASGLATANGRPQRAAVLALGRALRARPAGAQPSLQPSSQPTAEPRGPAAIHMTTQATPFFQRLVAATAADRAGLISAPIIQGALRGEVSVPSYLAFLREAYHHVRHTVPLLEACRARLPERLAWMRSALDEYIAEEAGHDGWILDDIAAAGGDAGAVRGGAPAPATEVMVAYAYDTIARGNPLGFLGMVHVLEGTSVALALAAADRIQHGLALPDAAFSYLRSHGTLDQEHTAHFEQLVNAIDDPQDQAAIVHATRLFYRLYGDVFRGLPLPSAARTAQPLPEAA